MSIKSFCISQVIAGFDYKQLPLNSSSACAHACCGAPRCRAWAVAKGLCWLKDGWAFQVSRTSRIISLYRAD